MKQRIHKQLEKAFDETDLANAKEIIDGYHIIVEKNDKMGYIASSVELPTVFADGKKETECFRAIREALTGAVATMIACGQKPPQSMSANKRTEQVNIRLTAYEKMLLTNKAVNLGFKGISDLVRNVVIKKLLKTL
jgi:predicted RNase H-like HicB family nuclease